MVDSPHGGTSTRDIDGCAGISDGGGAVNEACVSWLTREEYSVLLLLTGCMCGFHICVGNFLS